MSCITLRRMPPAIETKLSTTTAAGRTGLNKTIMSVLARASGVPERGENARDLSLLSGTWSEQEAAEFDQAAAAETGSRVLRDDAHFDVIPGVFRLRG